MSASTDMVHLFTCCVVMEEVPSWGTLWLPAVCLYHKQQLTDAFRDHQCQYFSRVNTKEQNCEAKGHFLLPYKKAVSVFTPTYWVFGTCFATLSPVLGMMGHIHILDWILEQTKTHPERKMTSHHRTHCFLEREIDCSHRRAQHLKIFFFFAAYILLFFLNLLEPGTQKWFFPSLFSCSRRCS